MKYVIVGNGVASIGAIEGIRRQDTDGEITVISEEAVSTYGRPLISYYLANKVSADKLPLRSESFYEDNKVQQMLSTRVASIAPNNHALTTEAGETVSYDKLLLATGGGPYSPPIGGLNGPDIYTFTTQADAEALMQTASTATKAVIVGAGLIALKAAEALHMRGLDVTLVVRSRIMRVYFDEAAGNLLVNHLEKKGIKFAQGATPQAVLRNKDGRVTGLDTDKGELEADFIVMAAGVRPRKELAEAAGLTTGLGVVVNDHMQTSDPDIFSAGDVTEAAEMLTGEPVVMPIWPNAYNQGVNAGLNMAEANLVYPGSLAMNSISYYGLPTMSIGVVNPPPKYEDDYEVNIHVEKAAFVYRKLVFRDNRLVGCILIGDVDHAGFYTGFIRFKLELSHESKSDMLTGAPSPLDWPEELLQAELTLGGAHAGGRAVA